MAWETEDTDQKLVICEDDEEVEVLVKLISGEGSGIPIEDVLTVSKHLSMKEFSEQINKTFGLNIENHDLLIRKFHHKFNTCVTVKTDNSTFLEDAAIFEVTQLPKQEDLKPNIKLETKNQLVDKLQETSKPPHSLTPIKQECVPDGFCNSSVIPGGSIQNYVPIEPANANSEESRPVFSQIESNCVYQWDAMPSKVIRDVCYTPQREFHAKNDISPEVRRKPNVLFHSSGKRKSLGHADAKYFKCGRAERIPMPRPLLQGCYNCDRPGHFSRDCPEALRCIRCKKPGHMSRDCPIGNNFHRLQTTRPEHPNVFARTCPALPMGKQEDRRRDEWRVNRNRR